MGFHILLRDRKKEERNEALKVVTWAERDANDERSFIRIHVRNTADRPILYVDALYEGTEGIKRLPSNAPIVLKDEEITLEVPRYTNGQRTLARGIAFQDANGFSWVKDIASHDVYRQSRLRRGDPTLRMLFLSFGTFRLYRSTKKRMRRA
ncbi:hypothetical protein ABZZ92_22750 [Streptomyces ardesiacus]|uniref:hypothetical protein n=1 Tax=Streptomyces TaxID=1883 RepID=UPI00131C06B5|nr:MULTISPECIES: hypothetical protein [unclassified Streptomyces]